MLGSDDTSSNPTLDARQIETWLIDNVAARLDVSAEEISPHAPFTDFGLDSASAIALTGELSELLGRILSPTLAWDHPTIAQLARHLAGEEDVVSAPDTRGTRGQAQDNLIAVIGIGCRVPGASDVEAFWSLLHAGVDATREPPEPRRSWLRTELRGGFLEELAEFDPEFFGISPREAESMDPQQRLLLEVTWEALEQAGVPMAGFAGTRTAVFLGISSAEHATVTSRVRDFGVYDATGNALSVAAGRLSYLLGLRGPSVAIDTACSSSLVAVHLAAQSLLSGDSTMAIAAGVNLLLAPGLSDVFARAGMLSKDGRCRAFDASADGYGRGEGCGVIVLKRLDDAIADGNRVLAVVRGSAVNQDGHSNGLTAPNRQAQVEVIREALERAGARSTDLDYLEAHGTGTPLGDPIELAAIGDVLNADRQRDRPLYVGSVKSNIGHLEAAAGIVGLIKTVLSLQAGVIPAHLHLQQKTPHVRWDDLPIEIPTAPVAWSPRAGSTMGRLAGVSSFGFSGTNAHILLSSAPESTAEEWEQPATGMIACHGLPVTLCLSAKSPTALVALAHRYADHIAADPSVDLTGVCHTALQGRSHFEFRMASVAETAEELQTRLRGAALSDVTRARGQRVAFVFPGQGAQVARLGAALYGAYAAFREAYDRILLPMEELLGTSLREQLTQPQGTLDPALEQPAIFAVQFALAQAFRELGIEPAAVVGHSVGAVAAACVAGVLIPDQAAQWVVKRGRLMASLPRGAMLAVALSEPEARALLERQAQGVAIAAINGPRDVVLSGGLDPIEALRASLREQGVAAITLSVSRAFHSSMVDPVLAELEESARELTHLLPTLPWVSDLTARVIEIDDIDAAYWRRHARQPVRHADALTTLTERGCDVCLELGAGALTA